ncbi:hypothetical protein ACFSKI_15175 [Pseudogracilibacillus auburnensis]|uniref:Uncharacterized protein n=1 Tax=Pseudogracilibacillus auburnensis TaxID=1494959 RepID=A0A2V3VPI9_9BACI|nr:hypothetical protein [Pseudogracilibacillus auburnensis]MBO1001398.1 hypothetical protein [Pseudogracilibacillus auburnensis]PXW83726.1 hypothetical protein DFR56_11410 [Pseudogracilibacillus auburnensis]
MDKIINQNREEYELLLIITTIFSVLTFKKIKKLECYRQKLKEKLFID